jgi:hypothetical protein
METATRRRRSLQFTIAETMILAAIVGCVIRWPTMLWIANPLAVYWLLRLLSIRPMARWWLPALGLYLILIPFTFAPLFSLEDRAGGWLADNKYYTLGLYRPVFRVVKYSPLYHPVWQWNRWIHPDLRWPAVEWQEK